MVVAMLQFGYDGEICTSNKNNGQNSNAKTLCAKLSLEKTWKTKVILFFAKPIIMLGIFDIDKVSKMVVDSMQTKVEIK